MKKKNAWNLALLLGLGSIANAACLIRQENGKELKVVVQKDFERPREDTILITGFLDGQVPPDCKLTESCWLSIGYEAEFHGRKMKVYTPQSDKPMLTVKLTNAASYDAQNKLVATYLKSTSPVNGFDFYVLQSNDKKCSDFDAVFKVFGIDQFDQDANCPQYRIEAFRSVGPQLYVRPNDKAATWTETDCGGPLQPGGGQGSPPPPPPK
jgi:hypothetical protein